MFGVGHRFCIDVRSDRSGRFFVGVLHNFGGLAKIVELTIFFSL